MIGHSHPRKELTLAKSVPTKPFDHYVLPFLIKKRVGLDQKCTGHTLRRQLAKLDRLGQTIELGKYVSL
jgi:hypothetical protein